jgi:hypothetical protein
MKSSYLSQLTKYVQDNQGDVYKVTPEHFLKMSPWKEGDDRRVYEIDNEDYSMLSCENACMIVNKQFANTIEKWEHNGKKYIANATGDKDPSEHAYLLSTLPSHSLIKKTKNLLKSLPDNQTLSFQTNDGLSELKMIKHKGKIYYILIINELLPRVKMYNLFGEFCQWANIKFCKPIFCETDKKYI